MIYTELCDLLGIEYPIFQGGMAWIADAPLAAAVSNGGGIGIVSAMNACLLYTSCVNSGIETVGVLTQYQPLVLNDYIGNGQPWDLDSMHGGVHVLPPYQRSRGADWYKAVSYTHLYRITGSHKQK